ncbi:DUF1003 domain-containing protein [Quadrisphaera sp. DSM 44207]|uniref:DUF1003 domain-containing protein n=1 Tax=Quadrisphaera sp. DSM 44207 TaxID=1881057 RepID=UPI0008862324|nr:DUF1003 domain-containing protein [Quadrisphaera sp. DSM 44207]SDQ71660.1 Uncharacterized membrane protein [Quadrisphaera sp. DSM 44207]
MAEDRYGAGEAQRRRDALDTPLEARGSLVRRPRVDPEAFGRLSEGFARFMGTPRFLLYMTAFVLVWLAWNTFAPEDRQFDPEALNYTLLTLLLSLQASYAAPLILLAQNRQDDRDRVALEQDRQRAERNLVDTEYLAREVAALRIALGEVATRDFVRSELRALLEELEDARGGHDARDGREGRDARDGREGRDARDGREGRDAREGGSRERRDAREAREGGRHRDASPLREGPRRGGRVAARPSSALHPDG